MLNKNELLQNTWLLYQSQLLGFIKSKINNQQDAEDILSKVFIKLLNIKNSSPMPENLSAWLYHVSKNQIIDFYRTKKSFNALPDNLDSEQEELSNIQQLSLCMLPMIKQLPDDYREVLSLSELDGLTNKAVAKQLALSLSAVKSRILRGRKILYKSLLQCCAIEQNAKGEVLDFNQKASSVCKNCN